MEQILDLARKVAEQAEVFAFESEAVPVAFETNRLKLLQARQKKGVALRLVKNGRIGFTATTRKVDPEELVAAALDVAQFGAAAKFVLPGPETYQAVDTFDPRAASLAPERLAEMGQEMINALLAFNRELICEASLSRETMNVRLLNSQGGEAHYTKSVTSMALEATLIRGTDMLFVGDTYSSCGPIENYMDLARSAIRQLALSENLAKVTTGTLPVLFTPHGVASAFMAPLTIAFNGRVVLQGSSPLVGRQGEQLFHPSLNVWDDATIDCRPTSSICDDEGVPTRRIPLIQDGVVGEFLYDLQTAGLAGRRSTGSASRSLDTLPAPSTSGLIIAEGNATFDDIVADIKEGLVVEQLMGASQGNVLGGDFSGNVLLGYKVENGQLVGRVKNTMVSGNFYDALKNIAALGKETRWVGSLRTPAICCASLSVAAQA